MKRLGDEAGKYAGEKLFQKKAPTPKPHGDIIMKELTKDQEKTVSIKILGGLNRFYGRPTSPLASIMAQNIQLFGPRGGGLVYKFKKIVGRVDFCDQFRKIIVRYKRIGYNINIMRQSACLVFNPITVNNFASLFNCTPVGRASDSMMAPT